MLDIDAVKTVKQLIPVIHTVLNAIVKPEFEREEFSLIYH
jgi:hypothetical protein